MMVLAWRVSTDSAASGFDFTYCAAAGAGQASKSTAKGSGRQNARCINLFLE
jgi:hypothetical protein